MTTASNISLSGLIGITPTGQIVYCSKELLKVFHTPHHALNTVDVFFKNHPFLLELSQSLDENTNTPIELAIGELTFLVEVRKDSDLIKSATWILFFTDITNIVKREKKLLHEKQLLLDSNVELERFSYVASHDLNEPLRIVSNFANLLREEYASKLDEEADTYINFIIDGSNKVQYLVNDLLTYNRACRAEIKPEWIQGEDIILLQAYYLKSIIEEKKAAITIQSDAKIYADSDLLGQVFYQLIKNAIQYNHHETPLVNIAFKERNQDFIISVSDNGIGIAEAHHGEIFKILKRINTRPDLSGSGIGLAVCKKLIKLHGGTIWLDSNENNGTIFYFTISKNILP